MLRLHPIVLDAIAATEAAWHVPFLGNAHELLLGAMKIATANLHTPNAHVYTNSMPIIQSSGTGKSRTVDEMAKQIFTLPFNFRSDDGYYGAAYPPPDAQVRDHLTINTPSRPKYSVAADFLVFFAALFTVVKDTLVHMGTTDDDLPFRWYNFLRTSTNRDDLYDRAIKHLRETVVAVHQKTVSGVQNADDIQMQLFNGAAETAKIEARALLSVIPHDMDDLSPVIVMYFDEAHTLLEYDTDRNARRERVTYYEALLTAVDALRDQRVFALSISTNPVLAKYVPLRKTVVSGHTHSVAPPAPFTELPFDIHWTFPLEEATRTLEELSEVVFMCRFGRPLFWTRYERGEMSSIRKGMVAFASSKLAFVDALSPTNKLYSEFQRTLSELAVLGTRILLEFDPRQNKMATVQKRLIENNMRIIFSFPSDGECISGYPSEPILAEAAACLMAKLQKETDGDDSIARILLRHLDDGYVSGKERGQMVARLLLTLATDNVPQRPRWGEWVLSYSQPVLLTSFLESLLEETAWARVMEAKPDNTTGQSFKDAFKHAKVRFTHFGRAGDEVSSTSHAAYAALFRGMAIQCMKESVVDIVIPVFFDNEASDRKVCEEGTTAILISVRTSASPRGQIALDEADIGFFPEGSAETKPRAYVSIVMEFGMQPAVLESEPEAPIKVEAGKQRSSDLDDTAAEAGAPPRKKGKTAEYTQDAASQAVISPPGAVVMESHRDPVHPRYSFFIYGCSPEVYDVVEDEEVYAELLESDRIFQEHPRQGVQDGMIRPDGQLGYSWVHCNSLHRTMPPQQDRVVIGVAPPGVV